MWISQGREAKEEVQRPEAEMCSVCLKKKGDQWQKGECARERTVREETPIR